MAKYLIVQFCITNKIVFKPDLDKCFEQNLVWFTIWQQWWTNFLKTSRLRRKSRLSNNSGKAELFICGVYQTNSVGPLGQYWKEGCEPSGVDSSALSACEEATCYTNLPSACRETAKPGTLNPREKRGTIQTFGFTHRHKWKRGNLLNNNRFVNLKNESKRVELRKSITFSRLMRQLILFEVTGRSRILDWQLYHPFHGYPKDK